jgi:hypothetical protein
MVKDKQGSIKVPPAIVQDTKIQAAKYNMSMGRYTIEALKFYKQKLAEQEKEEGKL